MASGQDSFTDGNSGGPAQQQAQLERHVAVGGEEATAALAGMGEDTVAESDRRKLAADLPADRYLDREESWLRFSQRVLELAEDPLVPLLERVRFESIFSSALDEFFMVRIAGRIRRMATGLPVESVTGKAPDQILENTLSMAREPAVPAVARRPARDRVPPRIPLARCSA